MAVVNILKNGTVVEDMSTVTVPREVVQNILKICQSKEGERSGKRTS